MRRWIIVHENSMAIFILFQMYIDVFHDVFHDQQINYNLLRIWGRMFSMCVFFFLNFKAIQMKMVKWIDLKMLVMYILWKTLQQQCIKVDWCLSNSTFSNGQESDANLNDSKKNTQVVANVMSFRLFMKNAHPTVLKDQPWIVVSLYLKLVPLKKNVFLGYSEQS